MTGEKANPETKNTITEVRLGGVQIPVGCRLSNEKKKRKISSGYFCFLSEIRS